ncbi:MAG: laccase domain-containing protein, partial [Cutibacterium sp.]|nr:laccase domain-containing protein [Cutibacterium sp.]
MVCHQVHGNEVWRVRPDDVEGWIPQRYLGNRVEG